MVNTRTIAQKTVVFFGVIISGALISAAVPPKDATKTPTNTEATNTQAPNWYISYYSPTDVITQVNYQSSKGVGSTIIWEMSGDVNPGTDSFNSLIKTLNTSNPGGYHIAYWADWNIYASTRALPYTAYFMPGAMDNGTRINNEDFD